MASVKEGIYEAGKNEQGKKVLLRRGSDVTIKSDMLLTSIVLAPFSSFSGSECTYVFVPET